MSNTRFVALLFAILFVVPVAPVQGERTPLLIASVQSLDGMFKDLEYLAEAAGAGQLGQLLTLTTRQYANGLDGTRAVTFYVDAEQSGQDHQFRWLVFLPTTDLQTFVRSASSQIGQARQLQDGIIETTGKQKLYLKQNGPWTLVSDSLDSIRAPSMPLNQIIRAVDTNVDISVRGFVGTMPPALRRETLQKLADRQTKELAKIDRSKSGGELRALLAQEKWQQIAQLLKDVDEFSIGWTTDSARRRVIANCNVTAQPGTTTYNRLSQFQLRPSPFASMLRSQAFATWNAVGQMPPQDIAKFEQLLQSAGNSALRELSTSRQFTDEATRQLTIQLAGSFLDAANRSLRKGFFDGAGMMLLSGNEISAVTGMQLADTKPLHEALVALASQSAAGGISWRAQLNAATYSGVAVHRVAFQTPADEALRRAVGPQIDITIGLGDDEAYLAWGKSGMDLIRQAVEARRQPAATEVLPFHGRVSLGPLLRLYAVTSADPNASRLLQSLMTPSGEALPDAILVKAQPLRDGVRFTMELDEGVLRTVGQYALISMQKRKSRKSATNQGIKTTAPSGR